MVYGLCRTLPGDRAFLSPSPLRGLPLTSLTPASRRQDHTILPSASALFVKSAARVHRIPSRVRDDREPPLRKGRDGGGYKSDLGVAASTISEIPKYCFGRSPSGRRQIRRTSIPRSTAGVRPALCRADPAHGYAARIFAMKRSSSSRSRALSLERLLAECSTSSEAEPVSVAPRLTCMISAAACSVPCATF